MTDRATIIARLQKLRATAESYQELGNAEAAATYAAKVQELLLKHKLAMSDVEFAEEADADPLGHLYFDPSDGFFPGGRGQTRRIAHIEQLAMGVAEAHDCDMLIGRHGQVGYYFVGRASDVEIVKFMFTTLGRTGFRLSAAAYRRAKTAGEYTRGFYVAWWRGYVTAIRRRYDDARQAILDAERAAGHGTALVRLDQLRLAVEKYEKDVLASKPLPAVGNGNAYNPDAYEQGHRAGQNVNLSPNAVPAGKTVVPRALGPGQKALPKGGR